MREAAERALEREIGPPPTLSDDESWYWSCYQELYFDRPLTQTGHRAVIPMLNIITYANHLGLSDFDRDTLIRVVRLIDFADSGAWNKALNDKNARKP